MRNVELVSLQQHKDFAADWLLQVTALYNSCEELIAGSACQVQLIIIDDNA